MDSFRQAFRDAFDRERKKGPQLPVLLLVAGVLGVVDLIEMYFKHDVAGAIGAILVWFVIAPALSYWWVRRRTGRPQ